MSDFFKKNNEIILASGVIVAVFVALIVLPKILSSHYSAKDIVQVETQVATTTEPTVPVFVPTHVETPKPVKAIYMTSWVASNLKLRNGLVDIMDTTEINSVVIDIKDYSGRIVYSVADNPELKAFGSEEVRDPDLREFIETLHKKGIYVIGRVAVFQDAYFVKHRPDLAVKNAAGSEVWKDRKGISWIDVGSREYWDYIIEIALESHKAGFDEINFDYIRFPSDGNMKDISFPHSSSTQKSVALKNFFAYLHDHLKDSGMKTSADLFGMTTTAQDDMGIGQLFENALPYFDYVMPMVYPSHYPASFMGFAKPEAHPYEVIQFAMKSAVDRAAALASTTRSTSSGQAVHIAELRPWLQDFGLGMTYGPAEVRAQIKATNDVGLDSWALWSASNKYTKSALQAE